MLWRLVEICLLRAGPQSLPAAPQFLALTLLGYFLVGLLVSRINFGFGTAAAISFLDLLLMAAFTQVILRIVAKPERFNQTLAALAGTGGLLSLLALPLILRHALSVSLMTGVGAGVLYSLISVMILGAVFPDAG